MPPPTLDADTSTSLLLSCANTSAETDVYTTVIATTAANQRPTSPGTQPDDTSTSLLLSCANTSGQTGVDTATTSVITAAGAVQLSSSSGLQLAETDRSLPTTG